MRKYQEWQETQTYFQHLSQLSRIRIRKPVLTPSNRLREQRVRQHMHSEPHHSKSRSESFAGSLEKVESEFLPMSLVPRDMRSALKNTLKLQRSMPQKEKEIVLQNFLLGRRIINTSPVIKKKQQDRQYRIYRKAFKNMNRSVNMHEQAARDQKLTTFRSACLSRQPIGSGRNVVVLRIHKMAFIKCRLDNLPDNQVRVRLRLGKRSLRSSPMSIPEIIQKEITFAFRRKDVTLQQCEGRLQLIRKNEVCDLGCFSISITQPLNQSRSLNKLKSIESITKNGLVCGTIEFTMSLNRRE